MRANSLLPGKLIECLVISNTTLFSSSFCLESITSKMVLSRLNETIKHFSVHLRSVLDFFSRDHGSIMLINRQFLKEL